MRNLMILEQYNNDINNNNHDRKKTHIQPKGCGRFITALALCTVLILLTLIAAVPTGPVQATVSGNETAATLAPSGASIGPAAGGTNVTTTAEPQSGCLSQNTTATGRPAVDAGGATPTTNNTTTTTVAPGGASIGANDTGTSLATAGNTTTTGRPAVDAGGATPTTNNTTTTTVAPGGASIC